MPRPTNRSEVLGRLRKVISGGGIIVGAGAGIGLSAKSVEQGGADLIIIYNSGRFRMAGRGSLAGLMPYSDANAVVVDMFELTTVQAKEILPIVQNTPVLAGVCGTDPFKNIPEFLGQLKELGFSGVQNFPTVGLIDGNFRRNLEETGMGYDKEVEMVRVAREMDIFTTPYVFNVDEAERMVRAGADVLVAHVGLTTSGTIGAETALSLDDAVKIVQDIRDAAVKINPEIIVICHGGPIAEPKDAEYVLNRTKGVHGFFGASSMERLPVEIAIKENAQAFKNLKIGRKNDVAASHSLEDGPITYTLVTPRLSTPAFASSHQVDHHTAWLYYTPSEYKGAAPSCPPNLTLCAILPVPYCISPAIKRWPSTSSSNRRCENPPFAREGPAQATDEAWLEHSEEDRLTVSYGIYFCWWPPIESGLRPNTAPSATANPASWLGSFLLSSRSRPVNSLSHSPIGRWSNFCDSIVWSAATTSPLLAELPAMSYYDPRDRRAYRVKRDRYSRPGGGYVEETYVDNRGGYGYDRDYDNTRLIRRGDSEESVVEEVPRDFPPGEYYYGNPGPRRAATARRARSVGRDPYYDDEYYRRDDYYRPRRSRRYDDRRDRYERRSSYSSSRSPSPRPRRRKSFGEDALGAIGGALGLKAARDHSRDRSSDRGRRRRYHSDSRSRSRGHRAKSEGRIAQAMQAALAAGAAEAIRVRKNPGPWTGDKGKRVLTAAVSAGGVDGLIDRDPNKHGGRHVLESILAGMATNHFVNGSRSKSRSRRDTRGRSQSGSGSIRNLAAAGVLAAAGKQAYDRFSRSRSRGRDHSADSQDSRGDDDGRGSKKRGSSVSRAINKGLAALGLDDKNQRDRARSSDHSDSEDDRSYRSSGRRRRSSRDVRSHGSSSGNGSTSRAVAKRTGSPNNNVACHSDCDSDSDLGSSDDEKREKNKMLRKELITGGLATVATIHAAHSVMKNIEAQKKRREAVREGEITKEQERKMQWKADLQNVASIGLAALGIKGAVGEWKEVQEQRKQHKEFEEKCKERHEKRLQRRTQSLGGRRPSRRSQSASPYGYSGPHYYDSNPYGADIPVDF
ncbi:hypothetical protein UA08_05460 [Talaromyces atroroseus]|uniref:TIM-barrel domain-containing protein n=1 Tax=Talaromyces atroroseus TaxID=1441469 RepID=A0A225AHW7_TALAT|nr:hypothetical protein UA08_05460 [Talaromyces atroroseus]OKL58883.1 hypothetical protein UA08_05460 [Talaromyces atroroseus]